MPLIKEDVEQNQDESSAEEEKAIIQESYEERQGKLSKSTITLRILILWILTGTIISAFIWVLVVWVIHLTGSADMRWLNNSDLKRIESILVGLGFGSISTFLTNSLFFKGR